MKTLKKNLAGVVAVVALIGMAAAVGGFTAGAICAVGLWFFCS